VFVLAPQVGELVAAWLLDVVPQAEAPEPGTPNQNPAHARKARWARTMATLALVSHMPLDLPRSQILKIAGDSRYERARPARKESNRWHMT
jgi:hypothetical protein